MLSGLPSAQSAAIYFLDRLRSFTGHDIESGSLWSKSATNSEVSSSAASTSEKSPIGPTEMTPQYREEIRKVLVDFLTEMKLEFREFVYDEPFAKSCCEDAAANYGFFQEDIDTPEFQLALHGAVAIAVTTFGHLKNKATQRWIALYTTCLIFFDDLTVTDPSAARDFNMLFVNGQPQRHRLLDGYAQLLKVSRDHFNPSCANLVVSSSLDFITGLVLDYDHKKTVLHKSAASYPRYFRTMMGVSTAFVIFTFPPHISLEVYIQIFPNMVNFIDDVNDIFSFYKEELVNEETNHIALLSQLNNCSKLESMKYLSDHSVDGARRARDVLSAHPEAYDIFTNYFLQGYVDFHSAASKRYKLADLNLA